MIYSANIMLHLIDDGTIPSEEIQLAAVSVYGYGYVIRYIINAGIIPSEQVQLAAVKQSEHAIIHIIKAGIIPSQAVKDTHYIKWEL